MITPPSYHRIISPTLTVPTDSSTPIPVGLLACQRDPLLRELSTVVVSCSIHHPTSTPATKKTKKAALAPSGPADHRLEVILHDTVIFPEGGGQPSDIGLLITTDGKEWEVVEAKRRGGTAVHFVRIQDGDVSNAVEVFSTGAKVTVALGQLGFDRRYDHMTMHTSQHMLSAILETRLQLPTLSWSLTAYPTASYVEIPRALSAGEISIVQNEANNLISEGREVHVEVEELNQSKEADVAILESGRSVGKALPEDYTGGIKRVIVIDGVDRNPCCGTHIPSIHNLNLFLLPHTEALSRSTVSSARLYFFAGPRLVAHLASTHQLLTSASATLSCGMPMVPDRITQVINERKMLEKRLDDVEGKMADFIARDLVQKISSQDNDLGLFKMHLHRTDDSGSLKFMSAVASSFFTIMQASSQALVVLSSSPSSQTTSSISVILAFGSSEKMVQESGAKLKVQLGIKGGGKGQRWSGKFTGVWKAEREGAAIDEVLQGVGKQIE